MLFDSRKRSENIGQFMLKFYPKSGKIFRTEDKINNNNLKQKTFIDL